MHPYRNETDETQTIIGKLTNSGLTIERVGENLYNVVSKATGAVLERLVPAVELARYERCMDYVARQHGQDIAQRFRYTKPVHSV